MTVDFTLAADGWLETVDVYSYKYGAGKYEKDGEYYVATEKADYIYHITVIQSNECENADVENPYAPEKIYVQSFDMMTEATGGTALGDVLEVEAATSQQKFYLQNVTPSTAIAELNPVTFEIDGEEIGFFDSRLMVNYAKSGGYIGIRPNELVGEYPLTIKVGDASKTVLVKVLAATPTSLTANVFDGVVYNKTTTASAYEGMNVRFNAVANVAYADSSFTAAISSSNAADATLTWDSEAGEYVFNSAVVGEYVITLTSTKAPSVTSTLTVSVNELPDVASILSGEYEYAMNLGAETFVVYTAAFTPDATAEGISGTVDVTWTNQGTVVYAYTYDAANGLQLTKTGGADLALTIVLNNEFALLVERAGSQYALTKKTAGGEEGGEGEEDALAPYAELLRGTYQFSFSTMLMNEVVFTPGSKTATELNGSVEISDLNNGSHTGNYTYVYTAADGLQLTYVGGLAEDYNYTFGLVANADMTLTLTKTSKSGGNPYTYALTQISAGDGYTEGGSSEGGEEGGEGEEGATSGTISVTTTDTYSWVDEYTFTATEAGKYTFTVPAGLGVFSAAAWDSFSEPEVDYNLSPEGGSFSVELAAGEEYVYYVGAFTKGDWEITWTYEEASDVPVETNGTISVTTTDTYGYNDEYTFTAPAAGTYSFYVPAGLGFFSKDAYDVYAPAELDFMENADGGYVDVTLAAGEAYVFYIGATTKDDWTIGWSIKDEEGGDVTPSSKQLVLGENTVNVTADDITAQAIEGYTFVVTEEGTYTFASNSLMIRVYVTETNFSNGTAYLTAGTYKVAIITAYASQAGNYQINVKYTAPVVEKALVVGDNDIPVSDEDRTAGGVEYTFVAEADGEYAFSSNDLLAKVYDENGQLLGTGKATLTAGNYKIMIGTQFVSSAGTYKVTVKYTAPVVESVADGSELNPYTWDAFPESLEVSVTDINGLTYYNITITEAGTYVFTFDTSDSWYNIANAEGTVLTSGYEKESFEANLAAGTYRIGLGRWMEAGILTVTASVKEASGESGETAVYLGANGSGRAMKITVDAAAGTVSVIRAALAGNSLDTAAGASEYTGTYAYDGSTVTCEISGCTITWGADGAPVSVVWASATYTNFILQ